MASQLGLHCRPLDSKSSDLPGDYYSSLLSHMFDCRQCFKIPHHVYQFASRTLSRLCFPSLNPLSAASGCERAHFCSLLASLATSPRPSVPALYPPSTSAPVGLAQCPEPKASTLNWDLAFHSCFKVGKDNNNNFTFILASSFSPNLAALS